MAKRSGDLAWFRRPRRPLSGFLGDARTWIATVLLLPCAFLFGLGVLLTEPAWGAKVGGVLVSLASVSTAGVFIGYLLRPVTQGDDPPAGRVEAHLAAVADWEATLLRRGRVEVTLSRRKVALTFTGILAMLSMAAFFLLGYMGPVGSACGVVLLVMALFLALLPHLEAATASGPAVRIDIRGIAIARWFPLEIPWPEVLAVRAHVSTERQCNVVVHVSGAFYERYARSRPFLLRITDAIYTSFTGCGFSIPATIAAEARPLATWLDGEARRRHPDVASGPQ